MSVPENSSENLSPNFDGNTSPQADPTQVVNAEVLGQKRPVSGEDDARSTKRRHINIGMSAEWRVNMS